MAVAHWITRTHPTYNVLQPTWQMLQEVYRGDGGFLDGSHLIAHPREVIYPRDAEGNIVKTAPIGYRDKYKRRQTLARYENFARTIVDTFVSHLFAKSINRDAEAMPGLADWWANVDGAGTHIADWMQMEQALCMVYGHVVVVMDWLDQAGEPRTRAEQGDPVLRCYTPLDVQDWIYGRQGYEALKVCEAVPRTSLDQVVEGDMAVTGDGAPADYQYVVWTPTDWTRYDDEGNLIDTGQHGFGRVPAVLHVARPVPGLAGIGASALGDPRLHRDHFNLVSELRELLRSQTFSMLNIQLGPDEEVGAARGRLGDAASTETIVWSKGAAGFIAPPDGPAAVYQEQIDALERKLYRMAGLPWEGDSASAESADSRRLKAMDLNRLLAMYGDEAERVEYQLAELWYRGTSGVTDMEAVKEALEPVIIHYPDEFATIDTQQAAADVRDVVTMGLGPTATAEAKKRSIPIVLPDLADDTQQTINDEIDQQTEEQDKLKQASAQALFRAQVAGAAPVKPGDRPTGKMPPALANGDKDGGQMQDTVQ